MTIKTFTPMQLWKDFDDSLSQESINIVSYNVKENYTLIKLFFNALTVEDGAVRVFIKLYFPTGSIACPTMLFIPDIVAYDAEEEMIKMTNLGFCTATFDYSGMEEYCATYPQSLKYGKLSEAKDHIDTAFHGADQTNPYLWSKITRRVITLLCSLPYVNEEKIALVSSNFGANMLLQVASMDSRVKCAITIFNNCSTSCECEPSTDEIERNRWEIGCSLQSYAKFLQCKFLMALGTNNADYDFLLTNDTIALLPNPNNCYIAASVGSDVCLKAAIADTIINWTKDIFDENSHVCSQPILQVKKEEDGELHIAVTTDASYDSITEAFVALSYGDEKSKFRKWKSQPISIGFDGKGQTTVPFYSHDEPIYAFVNVFYKNGSVYSSQVIKITQLDLLDLEPYRKNDQIIYEKKMGIVPFNTEINKMFAPHNNITFKIGARDVNGITINTGDLSTYNISDMSNVDENTLLQFDCYSARETEFEVVLTDCNGHEYTYTAQVENTDEWSKILVELNAFKDAAFVHLKQWTDIKKLTFRNSHGVLFNNILWV